MIIKILMIKNENIENKESINSINDDINNNSNIIDFNKFTRKDFEYMWRYEIKPSKILDSLYLGNKACSENYNSLKENGITNIIVCGEELQCCFPGFFEYKVINIGDYEFENIKNYFKSTYEYIDEVINNKKGKVLVHCAAGISRSASIVCSYLIKSKQINYEEAMKIIWQGRIIAEPNRSFVKQLKEWYTTEVVKIEN